MERVKHVNELKELQESDWVSLLEKIVHKEVGGLDPALCTTVCKARGLGED